MRDRSDPRGRGAAPSRRRLLAGLAAAALPPMAGARPAAAQAYPARPITVVAPYPPGGNIDITARTITEAMAREFGGRFVIDNRSGAGGMIGLTAAFRAEPDGYTLAVFTTGTFTVAPRILGKKPFTPADYTPIGLIATTPMVLEVNAKGRFTAFADLVAAARAAPGQVTIGHSGYGTTNHVAILLLQRALGLTFNIVTYRGSAPAIVDLLGGQIDAVMDQVSSSVGHLAAGSFRPLAVTTRARAVDLPAAPTLEECGLADFDVGTTAGLFAPARTPPAVVGTLSAALNAALGRPDLVERLRANAAVPRPGSPEAMAAAIQVEEERAEALVRAGVLKPE